MSELCQNPNSFKYTIQTIKFIYKYFNWDKANDVSVTKELCIINVQGM